MAVDPATQVTLILQAAGRGEFDAAQRLLPVVYDELHRLASAKMSKTPPGQTLQPTALVHEAYLRLVGREAPAWENRRHFFFAAARAMRDILVEQARRKASLKRGGDRQRVSPDHLIAPIDAPADDMLALDEALKRLEAYDATKHQIVMLRFFAGLTAEEAAEAMNVSLSTINREWRYIRARLHRELTENMGTEGRN
ncbi:MAG TPA: ECF-type sigma factor [Phycisphaerae bacterium]|nr:ECF-type sigma factor [Phycisphaerae bacterium]